MVRKASAYTPGFQGNQYIVTGCGVERFYTCKGEEGLADYGNKDCTFVNGPPGAKPKDAAPAPAPGGGDLGGPSPDSEGMDDDMDNG